MALLLCETGCERRAPGPELCVPFAEMLVGVNFDEVVNYPVVRNEFDAIVTACLTKPFSRRVFTCTAESRAPLDCLKRYEPELLSTSRLRQNVPRGVPRRSLHR